MRSARCLSLLCLLGLALSGTACTRLRVESEKRHQLFGEIKSWEGRSVQDFLKSTGWIPSSEYGIGNEGHRVLVFEVLGTPASPTTLTYTHTTPWTGPDSKYPGVTTTSGPNQPVAPPPGTGTVRSERITIPQGESGCRLTLWVDAKGIIGSWRLEGSECSAETLDRLKKS